MSISVYATWGPPALDLMRLETRGEYAELLQAVILRMTEKKRRRGGEHFKNILKNRNSW
jgi:hypothetical protein